VQKHQVRTKKKKTKMFNKGDAVSVLDETMEWLFRPKVRGVTIETEDGFDDIFLSMN
jgi:hypothetical protein